MTWDHHCHDSINYSHCHLYKADQVLPPTLRSTFQSNFSNAFFLLWKNTYVGLQPSVKPRGGLNILVALPAFSNSFRPFLYSHENNDNDKPLNGVSLTLRASCAGGYGSTENTDIIWALQRDFFRRASRHILEHTLDEVKHGIFFQVLHCTNVPQVSL